MPLAAWRRNVRLFVVYRGGMSAMVHMALSLPFYQSLGFSLAEYSQLFALQAGTILLLDIPTGFIADRFGYRRMLLLGVAIQAGGYCILAFTHDKAVAWVMQVVLAAGQATARGADGPLARQSAEALGIEFASVSRRGVAAMGIGEGTASMAAALLAWQLSNQVVPRAAMVLQALVFVVLLYVPWRMAENQLQSATPKTLRTMLGGVRSGMALLYANVKHEVTTNAEARWLVVYGAVIGATTQTIVPLVQPYFMTLNLDLWQYAALWGVYSYLWAAFSFGAGWYECWLGRWGALASLVVWGVLTNLAMIVLGVAGILAMAAFYFIRGVQMPIILDYMTGVVTPDRRATLLAVLTTAQLLIAVPMMIVLGQVNQHFSVQTAFAASAVVYGGLGFVAAWRLRVASH
jgi:MFS family permease